MDSGVVEDPDAGGSEVCADQKSLSLEFGAQVRQRGLRSEVLACKITTTNYDDNDGSCNLSRATDVTDNVGDILAVGEAAGGAVAGRVDAVGRLVSARRGGEEVVVAVVDEGVAEHEEGTSRRRERGKRSQS